ncbi:hypothetical protein B5P46_07395 [Rhizobium leguminosarum]|uniref:Uncharacterized protein n=1 Tax=Rhizobium leguminosarum TaxID=384 RepID=A0A4Q1UCY6_RHILE|nr:hypothetical protein B5P46_07395 [Rhizobium leguminosarum]
MAPSSDPSGHLLPAGEKGMCREVSIPSSPQRGEGARRADEGATRHTIHLVPFSPWLTLA